MYSYFIKNAYICGLQSTIYALRGGFATQTNSFLIINRINCEEAVCT